MRPFGSKRTHASNGEELGEMFIGEDGILSVYFQDQECEVVGYMETIHMDAFAVKPK